MSKIGNFFQKFVLGVEFKSNNKKNKAKKEKNIEPEEKFIPQGEQTSPVPDLSKLKAQVASQEKSEPQIPQPKQWTVLFYSNGNTRDHIPGETKRKLEGAAAIGSDKNINFVVQRASAKTEGMGKRLYLDKPGKKEENNIKVLEDQGKVNMGEEETLKDFLKWGMESYPAKHYMVVMAGHGGAFLGCMPDDISKDHLENEEMRSALNEAIKETGKKIDVMAFDACYMACAETAHALKDSVNYLVASEEMSYGDTWNYWRLAESMTYRADNEGELSVSEALNCTLKAQEKYTVTSILNLKKMPELTNRLRKFSDKLLTTDTRPKIIKKSFKKAQHYSQAVIRNQTDSPNEHVRPYDEIRDVYSLAGNIQNSSEIKDKSLKDAAEELKSYIAEMRVAGFYTEGLNLERSRGISIYAPVKNADKYVKDYEENTLFNQETGWAEVVKKFGMDS